MKIEDIVKRDRKPAEIVVDLKKKSILVPEWTKLQKEYDPKKHPVMDKTAYPDNTTNAGVEKMTRVTLGLQKLATKRMTELAFGIPVQRIYKTSDENEKLAAKIIEDIYAKNRINSENIKRFRDLYSSCEMVTLWFGIEENHTHYGNQPASIKLRCRNYSPKAGYSIYPLFDENDDLIALSFEYTRADAAQNKIAYLDVYTKTEHIRYVTEPGKETIEELREEHKTGKIPAIYGYREEPIWEDTSENVYEMEWALSRNGNYLRKNSKPIFGIFSDEEITLGKEKDDDSRLVLQFPTSASAKYITWPSAPENLKFHIAELTKAFFQQLQLPDSSFENMKATPMSGEARKMMFIDAHLKVTDESGAIIEFLDREFNVIREFCKVIFPSLSASFDKLQVEMEVTPFTINDQQQQINNLTTATGGKPIMAQATAIKNLGWVDNVDAEMALIRKEENASLFEPTED